jgi:uncharacterized membrane protein (DUF485 family)
VTRKHSPPNADLTPHAGSATDVAPLGRSKGKPPHEQTADEDRDVADWERLAASAEFKALLKAKAKFVVPATVFFIVYYFSLPLLFGVVNVAYLFALSQFFMAWLLAWAYVRAAARFDRMARDVIDQGGR